MFIISYFQQKIVNMHRNKGKPQVFFNGPSTLKNYNEYLRKTHKIDTLSLLIHCKEKIQYFAKMYPTQNIRASLPLSLLFHIFPSSLTLFTASALAFSFNYKVRQRIKEFSFQGCLFNL